MNSRSCAAESPPKRSKTCRVGGLHASAGKKIQAQCGTMNPTNDPNHAAACESGTRIQSKTNVQSMKKAARPNKITLTKKIPFRHSKDVSRFIWKLHQEARWCFNHGVKLAFDNRRLSKFDAMKHMTGLRHETEWVDGVSALQRANIVDGFKTIRLAQKTRKKFHLSEITSPKPYFRKKQDKRQPAISSYQPGKIKNGIFKLGKFKLHLKTHEFDGMKCLSFQIVETTKKITKFTTPGDRTYKLHLAFPHFPVPRMDGDSIGIDLGVRNMMGIANLEESTTKLVKMPNEVKRHKHDYISALYSKRSKVKKHGRKWSEYTREIDRLTGKKSNQRTDFIRKTVKSELNGAKAVAVEDLDILSMVNKRRQYYRNEKNTTGLNREIHYSVMGMVKDYIRQFCQKNGITVNVVNRKYTSTACHACGLIDKRSRNGETFHCISCGMEYHADTNAAINILCRWLRKTMPLAVGRIVMKQKGSTAWLNSYVWKEKTNPICLQGGEGRPEYFGSANPRRAKVPLLLENHVGGI